jgi:hypothetical protein
MEEHNGHSAEVRIDLILNGQTLSVGQLGPDFLVLDHPAEQPAGTADILMSVDGREQRWSVRLPEGLRLDQRKVRISSP